MSNAQSLATVKRQLSKRISIANDENAANTIAVQKLQNKIVHLYGLVASLAIALGAHIWLG